MPWQHEEKMKTGRYFTQRTEYSQARDFYGSDNDPNYTVVDSFICPVCTAAMKYNGDLYSREQDYVKRLCPNCREDRDAALAKEGKINRLAWISFVLVCVASVGGLVALGLLVGTPAEDVRKQEPGLQGKWQVVSYQVGVNPNLSKSHINRSFTIDGYTIDGNFDYSAELGTLKLDPTASPAQFDIRIQTGSYRGGTLLGIYRLEGDTLTISHAGVGQRRPTEFVGSQGTTIRLIVAQRIVP